MDPMRGGSAALPSHATRYAATDLGSIDPCLITPYRPSPHKELHIVAYIFTAAHVSLVCLQYFINFVAYGKHITGPASYYHLNKYKLTHKK
jgi:hypothetical protein